MTKNEQVAIELGWERQGDNSSWWRSPEGSWGSVPDYEHDIKEAWTLADKLPGGWYIISPEPPHRMTWTVFWNGDIEEEWSENCPTASAAIVNAFLAAKGVGR